MSRRDRAPTRRTVLQGAMGTLVALPLLQGGRARAQQAPWPLRFVVFFTPNGVNPESWYPPEGSTERDWVPGRVLRPLAPFKDRLTVTRGIDMRSPERGPGEPHQKGMGGVLSGSHLQEGDFVGGDGTLAGWGDGVTIDQIIAGHIGRDTRLASLELGVRVTGSEVRHRLNYSAPANPLQPIEQPGAAFARLFGATTGAQETLRRLQLRRRSVLDAVYKQFAEIRRGAAAADRLKLDAHAAMVRDLERRLRIETAAACERPDVPPVEPLTEANMAHLVRSQMQLAVTALACDQTRVLTLQMSSGANNIRFPFLNSDPDDHTLSHAGPSDGASREEWVRRKVWYSEQLAWFLGQLDGIEEGDGTLLDHTVLLWVSDVAQGATHSHDDMPFVLAGGAGGRLSMGRYVQFAHAWHNELLLTLAKVFDVPVEVVGDADYCQGPLETLLA